MGMHDTIDLCEKAVREALREYEGQYPNGTKVLGWGVASGFKNSGIGKGIFIDDGACRLTLDGDGKLHMIVSGTDMGQGFRTGMMQIAAETLRMDMKDIDIVIGDTDITIPTGESVSERQTLCDGRAVYEACRLLQKELEENPPQPGESRYAEYYFRAPECFAIGNFKGAEEKGVKYRNFPAYAYATQAAIVEVDTATGRVKLLKVIAAHDVGRAINPRIIEGQMQGSVSMGQGYALTEGHPTKKRLPGQKALRADGASEGGGHAALQAHPHRRPGAHRALRREGRERGRHRADHPGDFERRFPRCRRAHQQSPGLAGGHSGGHPHREMRCSHHGRTGRSSREIRQNPASVVWNSTPFLSTSILSYLSNKWGAVLQIGNLRLSASNGERSQDASSNWLL